MNIEKLRSLHEIARKLRNQAQILLSAEEKLVDYISERENDVELELDKWACHHCHWVYSRWIGGVFKVPQPEDGVLTCTECGETMTTEEDVRNIKSCLRTS